MVQGLNSVFRLVFIAVWALAVGVFDHVVGPFDPMYVGIVIGFGAGWIARMNLP